MRLKVHFISFSDMYILHHACTPRDSRSYYSIVKDITVEKVANQNGIETLKQECRIQKVQKLWTNITSHFYLIIWISVTFKFLLLIQIKLLSISSQS